MRISNIFLIFIIVILFYLTGCEKQVHRMELDPVEKHLVLNGSMGPDLPFKIHVSSSMEPIGPELVDLVEDAEIIITDEHNNSIYPQYDSMGFYEADWYPEINKKYRISVKAPNYKDSFVDVMVPGKLTNISLSKDSENTTYPYVLNFTDTPEEENSYIIRAWYQYKEIRRLWMNTGQIVVDTIIERKPVVLRSNDEHIKFYADGTMLGDTEVSTGEKSSTGFLISDELFNGKEHILSFKATYIRNLDPDRPYLFVEVVTLNMEFYNFVKSYCLYYDALQSPFAEPVAILTNVENGLGYFYGYSVNSDSVRLD